MSDQPPQDPDKPKSWPEAALQAWKGSVAGVILLVTLYGAYDYLMAENRQEAASVRLLLERCLPSPGSTTAGEAIP